MTRRGLSTALDVVLCLLLVGAAVATLATARGPPADPATRPGPTAVLLGGVGATSGTDTRVSPLGRLGAAAVADAAGREAAVSRLVGPVEALLNRTAGGRQVVVRWQPVPGLGLRGAVTAGATPPPTAAVDSVRLEVPLPAVPRAGNRSVSDAVPATREALADRFAARLVRRLARPCEGVAGVRDGACGVAPDGDRHARLATDLRALLTDRADTVAGAHEALALGRVVVVVRTWSA